MIKLIREITKKIFTYPKRKFYTVKRRVHTQEVMMSKIGVNEGKRKTYYANRELSWLKFNKRV